MIVNNNRIFVLKARDEQLQKALEKIGIAAQGYATLNCVVDTGRLRASTTYATTEKQGKPGKLKEGGESPAKDHAMHQKPKEKTVVIGTNVEYGEIIETRGGRQGKGAHYLRNSISDHLQEYQKIIKEELKD
jgi:hypothetical protein